MYIIIISIIIIQQLVCESDSWVMTFYLWKEHLYH